MDRIYFSKIAVTFFWHNLTINSCFRSIYVLHFVLLRPCLSLLPSNHGAITQGPNSPLVLRRTLVVNRLSIIDFLVPLCPQIRLVGNVTNVLLPLPLAHCSSTLLLPLLLTSHVHRLSLSHT
jgi:hypothetical protein